MDVVFDIDNLMPADIKERLNTLPDINGQIDFLIKLIDYIYNFNDYEVNLIKSNYVQQTGEEPPILYISDDDKNLIYEYGSEINDIEKVKNLINGLCSDISEFRDSAIKKAESELCDIQFKRAEEADRLRKLQEEERKWLLEDIEFNGDTDVKQRKTLNSLFADAEAKLKRS